MSRPRPWPGAAGKKRLNLQEVRAHRRVGGWVPHESVDLALLPQLPFPIWDGAGFWPSGSLQR